MRAKKRMRRHPRDRKRERIVRINGAIIDALVACRKLHPHGLTPPMRNVRRRRFRKPKTRAVTMEDIEGFVKELLRADFQVGNE